MCKYTVYRHISPNGKMYVGITSQAPERRYRDGKGYKWNKHFTNAINKYGWKNFRHEILLDNLTRQQAECAERLFIGYWKTNHDMYGYNIDAGGRGGVKMAKSTKQKLSVINLGKKLSSATKAKIGLKSLGRRHTLDTKQKISMSLSKPVAMYDRHVGELLRTFQSTQEASRQTNIAQGAISQCCNNISKGTYQYTWRYYNGDAPKRLSDDDICRINHTKAQHSILMCAPTDEVLKRFCSIEEAAQYMGVHRNTISRYLRGERKPLNNLVWKYNNNK